MADEQPIQYTSLPVFGQMGTVNVNSAPQGSGMSAQAYAPVQSGSSSMTSPTAGDYGGGGGGVGGNGGGGGGGDQPAVEYPSALFTICEGGFPTDWILYGYKPTE